MVEEISNALQYLRVPQLFKEFLYLVGGGSFFVPLFLAHVFDLNIIDNVSQNNFLNGFLIFCSLYIVGRVLAMLGSSILDTIIFLCSNDRKLKIRNLFNFNFELRHNLIFSEVLGVEKDDYLNKNQKFSDRIDRFSYDTTVKAICLSASLFYCFFISFIFIPISIYFLVLMMNNYHLGIIYNKDMAKAIHKEKINN